jgi:hypothetical protein
MADNNINDQIEYEEESSHLDFKAIEYKSSTNAELVKDVLAFANSHHRGDKRIIVGVKKEDGKVTIIPVINGTDSAAIQQLILENISPHPVITYEPFIYNGKSIRVLTIIDENNRPYMLTKDLLKDSKLFHKKGSMVIRKGTTTPAINRDDLDRIYKEKQSLQFSFEGKVNIDTGNSLPNVYFIHSIKGFELPSVRDKQEILYQISFKERMLNEDLEKYRQLHSGSYVDNSASIKNMDLPHLRTELNFVENHYGAIDHYFVAEENSNQMQLSLTNDGITPLKNVEIIFTFPQLDGLHIEPKIPNYMNRHILKGMVSPPSPINENYPSVDSKDNNIFVTSKLGDLKHKQHHDIFLEPLRIWADETLTNSDVPFTLSIFADNLPKPIVHELILRIDTE